MINPSHLHKIVAAAIGRENANVWVKQVNVSVRDHKVNALVFPESKNREGISAMSRVWEGLLGKERVDYGQAGPHCTGNSASQLKHLLINDCNLKHHEICRNGYQGKNDDTNWDNYIQVFWHDNLHEGGVHPGVGHLPKMGKKNGQYGKHGNGSSNYSLRKATTTKKAPGSGGSGSGDTKEEEDAAKDATKTDERASRAANSAKKKSDSASKEADAMPEEDSKPAAKENESSGGRKRKATGGKKKDPNAPKNPRSGKDL